MQTGKNQRFWAVLLAVGISILLYRTIGLLTIENGLEYLAWWVIGLTIIEFMLDLLCLVTATRWFILNDSRVNRLPLRIAAAATLLHAVRVGVFVLGRTGPWVNFDIRPEFREAYTFEWFWVYFAGVLSVLGVAGVVVVWQLIKRHRKRIT